MMIKFDWNKNKIVLYGEREAKRANYKQLLKDLMAIKE